MLPALIFKYLQAYLSIKERRFHQISNPQETPLTRTYQILLDFVSENLTLLSKSKLLPYLIIRQLQMYNTCFFDVYFCQ